ncbi:MAG TPA: hypothetical protein VJJ78_01095, partial [Candidatus Saccharimonadales bacterium]|nr:hypothetical protein [Candidatus Saccharimonadales bacterium]
IHRGHEKSVGSSTQKRDGVHFGYTRDPNAKTRLDLELHATSPDNAVATIKSRFQHGRERTVKGPRAITLGAAAARRVGLIE